MSKLRVRHVQLMLTISNFLCIKKVKLRNQISFKRFYIYNSEKKDLTFKVYKGTHCRNKSKLFYSILAALGTSSMNF